ncbi:cytochrome P450 [Rhodobacteraceae bacterium NNCM2]|nr:cytochrome P450 [Coraliihabitans acroporae]
MGHSENDHRLFGPDMLGNPYPTYKTLRDEDPVQWNETVKAWVLTSHEAVAQVLKSHDSSADRVSAARGRYDDQYQPAFDVLSRIMVQVDDPVHRNLRDLVHSAFTRTAVFEYEQAVEALCHKLLAPGLARGEIEFMSEFAVPLPLMVISEIVGVPPEDREMIKEWCDAYTVLALNFYVHMTDAQLAECNDKVQEFCDYLRRRIAEAEAAPGPDLISSLAIAASKQHSLTMDEVVANCILLLNAGNETTSCLLGSGMRMLMEHPDQLALLRADPALIPNAIAEFLRIEPPVQFLGRIAASEMEVGGKKIAQGDMMLTVIGAANRDPDAFDEPDRLDVTRIHNRQLGFSIGPHLCAGIQLARFEAMVAFRYLLEHLASFEPAYETLDYMPNFNMRGLAALPMRIRGA